VVDDGENGRGRISESGVLLLLVGLAKKGVSVRGAAVSLDVVVLVPLKLAGFPLGSLPVRRRESLGLGKNPIGGSGMKEGHEVQVGSNR